MAKRQRRLSAFFIICLFFPIFFVQGNMGFAQDSQVMDCDLLTTENRKLASALADATSRILAMKDNTQACPESNEAAANKDETIIGLKETIRQLQAQNKHLSSAGTMGKTITNQVISLQERVDELTLQLDREKQNTAVFRQKIQDYESQTQKEISEQCASQDDVNVKEMRSERLALSREITELKLQQQELKARLELMKQKGGL